MPCGLMSFYSQIGYAIFIFEVRLPISMQDILENHKFEMDYSGKYSSHSRVTLGGYLESKPDTKRWREIFLENNAVPVSKAGRIFPHWALLDLYKLMAATPGIEAQILRKQTSLSDLPTLEETIDTLSE